MNPTCFEDIFEYVLLPNPSYTREQYTFFKDGGRIMYRYTTKDGRQRQGYYYGTPFLLFETVKYWEILRPIATTEAYNPVHNKIAELNERFAKRKKVSTTYPVTPPGYVVQHNSW